MSRRAEVWRWGDSLDVIREALIAGGMLAVPTESSYALAVDPRSAEGVESVYRFKARSCDKPLPVVAGTLEHLAMLGIDFDDPGLRILASLWPAPLSIVMPIRQPLPAAGASGSLAVRIPDHPRLVELLTSLQSPLTATSANSAGEAPICDPVDLANRLGGWPAVIVDDGHLPGGAPSTMVALRPEGLEVLRSGRYPIAELRRRLSELGWSAGFSATTAEKSADHSPEAR
jgi:L-threonylcarbamoyladenylate synthase